MKQIKPSIKATPIKTAEVKSEPIVKEMEPVKQTKVTLSLPLLIIVLAIVMAGGFTGYVLAKGGRVGTAVSGGKTSTGLQKVVGIQDEKTFKDSAEGTLREGGTKGEGSHHLERPGGESQNVYLTSSTVSLDDYVGKKIKVWGQTFDAQRAGWLMDVGRLELLE